MLQSNEIVITQPSPLSEEYTRRGVYRYIWTPETINIRDRQVLSGGAKFLPAGQMVEIVDIPIPYYDSDMLEDERENADVAIHNKNSPTGGAKFKPKTSFAIVDELLQNYAVRGLVYFEALSTTNNDGRKAAAIVEAKLKLEELVQPQFYSTLEDALDAVQSVHLNGIPKGTECLEALIAGLSQAIAYRQAWAQAREAEIQLGLKGKPGRVATFQAEREYAASVGIVLTDANVMRKADAVARESSPSPDSAIATKLLLEQNDALADENQRLKAQLDSIASDFAAIKKELGIKDKK